MSKQERQVMRALGINQGRKGEEAKVTFFKNSFLGKTWYLERFFDKLIFVLGFLAFIWTIFKLAVFGHW